MSYAGNFLKAAGYPCTILRNPTVDSYISKRKASKSMQKGEFFWEGLILADSNLKSGDIFQIGEEKFLVQHVHPSSGELAWFAVKTNVTLDVQRYTESVDEDGNFTQAWSTIASSIAGFGEVVTSTMKQLDVGLKENTKYKFQIPMKHNLQLNDRVWVKGEKTSICSIDNIMISGVLQIQCEPDLRP